MYKLAKNGVIRLSDTAFIPTNNGTPEWGEYLQWLENGNVPEPYGEPPTPIPSAVTMRQAREALIRRGLLSAVEGYLTGMVGIQGELARNEWTHSRVVERNRPLTLAMAQVLGLQIPEELDELFVFAATL